jgi:hypothetical protein
LLLVCRGCNLLESLRNLRGSHCTVRAGLRSSNGFVLK